MPTNERARCRLLQHSSSMRRPMNRQLIGKFNTRISGG
jgi:hypothetical protein